MAIQFTNGSISSNEALAWNLLHRAEAVGSNAHYDGPEYSTAGVEQVIDDGVPATLTAACLVLNKAKARFNDHLTRHNGGDNTGTYAHKVVDNANTIAASDMDTGANYESTILTALITLVTELRTDFSNHIANLKPDGSASGVHGAADSTNVLGGAPTLTTAADVAVELNNIKAQYELHRVFTAGGVHGSADSTNTVTAANAVATDWDSMITLANQLRTKLNAHDADGTAHSVADTFNTVTGSAVSYPSGLFTLAPAIKTAYEAHRASTTYHATADSTNTLGFSTPVTTIAGLIAAAAEIRTDLNAHLRFARTSQAVRILPA